MAAEQLPKFPFSPIHPGGYSVLDSSALLAAERADLPTVAVVGDCTGGAPNAALKLSGPANALKTLRSGPALDCVRAAYLGGAATVLAVRVGNAIARSTKVLAGTSGTGVTLTSIDYGSWTNGIRVLVEANNKVTISYTDALGVKYSEVYDLGAAATAVQVANAINGKDPRYAASRYVTAVAGAGTMPLATAADAAMTSGADTGTIVSGDWTTALVALESERVDLLVVATGDATVHAQAVSHVNAMSASDARAERVQIAGGIAGEDVATVTARMSTLHDKRFQFVYPGVTLPDELGVSKAYAPFVAAAFTAGRHAGLPDPATALTFQSCDVIDVERRLSTIKGGDVDKLLAVNITPIEPDPAGGFRYADSLSGWNSDNTFRDLHKIRAADEVARRLRGLEKLYTGRKALPGLAAEMQDAANAVLEDLTVEEIIFGHLAAQVLSDPNDQRTKYINAPVVLPDTNKYTLISVALLPASALTS